jgi:hypothetical protein
MLPSASLSDYTPLAHPLRQKRLPKRVVDFVRSGMCEVFALQKNARLAMNFRQTLGLI